VFYHVTVVRSYGVCYIHTAKPLSVGNLGTHKKFFLSILGGLFLGQEIVPYEYARHILKDNICEIWLKN
jgi:hypothetical protein